MISVYLILSLVLLRPVTVAAFQKVLPVSSHEIGSITQHLPSQRALQLHRPCSARHRIGFLRKLHALKAGIEENFYNFEQMKSLDVRLGLLESVAPDDLTSFYEPSLKSFSLKPGQATRLSVTSTCFSLLAVLAAGEGRLYDGTVDMNLVKPSSSSSSLATEAGNTAAGVSSNSERTGMTVDGKIPIQQVLQALLCSEWREDDLFQVSLLLYTLLKVDKDRVLLEAAGCNEEQSSRLRKLMTVVFSARPRRAYGNSQLHGQYITFQACRTMAELRESTPLPPTTESMGGEVMTKSEAEVGVGGLPLNAVPDGAASQVSLGLARCAESSFNTLCRQLAYRSAGDTTSFDVMRLSYSLLTYIRSTEALAGTAGRELVPGQGPSPGTRVQPLKPKLVQQALAAFFDEQLPMGLWDKGEPINRSFGESGRSVGNAFVFAVDTIGSLLEALPAEDFRPHLPKLQRTLDWIEIHQAVEVIPDYCDTESGQCYGKALRGWASPHLSPDTGPQAWSTAQTLTCISLLRRTIRELMHDDVLNEFGGTFLKSKGPQPKAWDRLLDTDLGDPTGDDYQTLKSVLQTRVLTPFASSIQNPSFGAAYSAILFGPPGTAKTTICEAMAQNMGWDFLVIDTAAFLADGLTNVAARIRYVFERLQALEECVILFDEIEEFCLDRETPGLGMESRMLTTAMLTAINDLRRAKRSVFFLATNRLRAFDSAITRPGRFDMQLFVGTPNLEARVIQLQQQMERLGLNPTIEGSKAHIATEEFRSFLERVWSEDAMFMNYLEGMQFAAACANLVAAGDEEEGTVLSDEEMQTILDAQTPVMTVRGQVREEYKASMVLSRL